MQVWHCNTLGPQDASELIWKTHFKSSSEQSKLRLLLPNKDFYSTAALWSPANDRLMRMTYSKQVFLH